MLSRVAEAIYWAGRYIERAENTARMIRVNSYLMMDTPKGISPGWEPLISIAGLDFEFNKNYDQVTERNVVKFLIGDQHNLGSILNSIKAARDNCRTIREIIPRTAWQKLNTLFLFAKEGVSSGLTQKGRDDYLDGIISGSQQLIGLLGSEMYRDEAWHFIRIGRNIERAEMTTRIADICSADLLSDVDESFEAMSFKNIQLISVLKSLSAYSIYRRKVHVRVDRASVLELLFKDENFPRSLICCIHTVENSVSALSNNKVPLAALRTIEDALNKQDVESFKKAQLHDFIDELQISIRHFHGELEKQYFLLVNQ